MQRGVSPRIVEADVVGSRGRTRVTGGQLRARFGLFDTWAFFTSITSGEEPPPDQPAAGRRRAARSRSAPPPACGARPVGALAGRVLPVLKGAQRAVQVRQGGSGSKAGRRGVRRGGRYSYAVTAPGVYRVRYHDENGPAVRVP